MSVNNKENLETHWHRDEFNKLMAGLPPERIAEDREILQQISELAKTSPLVAEALTWAQAQGIAFHVDHKTQIGGFYLPTTGVVTIGATSLQSPDRLAEVVVHELRHAWQESIGFLAARPRPDFEGGLINLALIEADAYAHGKMAQAQVNVVLRKRKFGHLRNWYSRFLFKKAKKLVADENAGLRSVFRSWFQDGTASGYGESSSRSYGVRYGLQDAVPVQRTKDLHVLAKDIPLTELKVDIFNPQDVLRLGTGFNENGNNYLTDMPRDFFVKEVLNPSLADTFWGAASPEQRKLTTELRKEGIRRKLAQPKARHPWP